MKTGIDKHMWRLAAEFKGSFSQDLSDATRCKPRERGRFSAEDEPLDLYLTDGEDPADRRSLDPLRPGWREIDDFSEAESLWPPAHITDDYDHQYDEDDDQRYPENFCAQCGTEIPEDQIFCASCQEMGIDLKEEEYFWNEPLLSDAVVVDTTGDEVTSPELHRKLTRRADLLHHRKYGFDDRRSQRRGSRGSHQSHIPQPWRPKGEANIRKIA